MLRQWIKNIYSLLVDRPYPMGRVLLERYQIVKILGIGSYGISYLCRDPSVGNLCVVKQVKPSIKRTRKGLRAYEYETSVLKKLGFPTIPRFYDRFNYDGNMFFSMEYIPGSNLEDHLFEKRIKYTEPEALRILLPLLETVEYLHSRQLVHRDIRIPNIIVKNDKLYLIDFGLVRYLDDNEENEEESHPHFIEKQLRREIHVRSDFYALGHVLLFLLYTTYEGETETARSWEEELSIHPRTQKMIRKMLQIDSPYSSIAQLRTDLLKALS